MNPWPFSTSRAFSHHMDVTASSEVAPSRVPRDLAFQLVADLFSRLKESGLAGSHYLAFGSVARELLAPQDTADFGDIDLLTIRPLSQAMDDVQGALSSLGIKHDRHGDGCLLLFREGLEVQLQLVDLEYSKKAFPGGFVGFKDSVFEPERCVQYPDGGPCSHVPCVPQAFLHTRDKGFYYKGDSKADPQAGKKGREVSAFSLDF